MPDPGGRLLHIAPEPCLAEKFRQEYDYLSIDLDGKKAMIAMDLTDMTFDDNSFDAIVCNHVSEHIPNAKKAMKEFYRALKPGGWASLQVPIKGNVTQEDLSITNPKGKPLTLFLVIVGDGSERESLENLARMLGVDTHVMFMGPVPHDEVRYFFNGCDLFLSLYDHSNLCNPVLEALTCGKCIITINDGSTKDLLVNGYNAILINKSALERELPETIISLLLDKGKRDRIARNVRNYAQRYLHSWEERMAMEIREIECLSGGQKPSSNSANDGCYEIK